MHLSYDNIKAMRLISSRENIYALEVMIQTMTEICTLPLAPDIYVDHVLEELFFIDRSLSALQKLCEKIANSAEREKGLLAIARARNNFERLITRILEGKIAKSLPLTAASKRLESIKINQEKESKRIQESLNKKPDADIVSPEEMAGLLSPPKED